MLDAYLLSGTPSKTEVVTRLLDAPSTVEGAGAFYEGMRQLGARTPDLALIALRLVLAGKKADDTSVTRLRDVTMRARGGDAAAREEYVEALRAS